MHQCIWCNHHHHHQLCIWCHHHQCILRKRNRVKMRKQNVGKIRKMETRRSIYYVARSRSWAATGIIIIINVSDRKKEASSSSSMYRSILVAIHLGENNRMRKYENGNATSLSSSMPHHRRHIIIYVSSGRRTDWNWESIMYRKDEQWRKEGKHHLLYREC